MSINFNNVKALFELFSGEQADSQWAPVLSMALTEVQAMLLPDADDTESSRRARLNTNTSGR